MKVRGIWSVLVACAFTVTACVSSPPVPTTTPQGSATQSQTPTPGGRVVIGVPIEPVSFNPIIQPGDYAGVGLLYRGLQRTNPQTGTLEPDLAAQTVLSPDGLTVTYTLRDNLVWSDGVPFSGEDYKYTVMATLRSKKALRKGNFSNITGAADYQSGKTDDLSGISVSGKTITVKFAKPFCPGLELIGFTGISDGIIPQHSFIKDFDPKTTDLSKTIDDSPLNMAPPASMGPYKFQSYTQGVGTTHVRNDTFYGGKPYLDEVVYRVYPDATALKNALKTGEVMIASAGAIDREELSKVTELTEYKVPSLNWHFIAWNTTSEVAPFLADKSVRQALTYGLNVDAIVDKIFFGQAPRIYSMLPPNSWASDAGVSLNKYPYDTAKAKQLLEQAGAKMAPDGIYRWTNGQPMQLKIETNNTGTFGAERSAMLQFVAEQYRQIGIDVQQGPLAFQSYLDRLVQGRGSPDIGGIIASSTMSSVDPDYFYRFFHSSGAVAGGQNYASYKSPEVDRAFDAARNGPDCSAATRTQLYRSIDKQLNDDVPFTFLFTPGTSSYAQKSIQGYNPGTFRTLVSTADITNLESWWIKR
jgi:peptide/nickel transport system substrate-binding protein